jgi:hypothetical protein
LLLLDEDLYWKGLYDKVEWKHMTKTDSAEINDYLRKSDYHSILILAQILNFLALSNSVVSNPTLSPVPQDCCYKKKFFKRYLLPAEKKARTTSQINEMYNRIRKVETKRDAVRIHPKIIDIITNLEISFFRKRAFISKSLQRKLIP